MHTLIHIVLAFLFVQYVAATQIKYDIPGRCPDMCSSNIEQMFSNCISKVSDGCALKFCGDNKVECGLKTGTPARIFPGELVDIRNVKPAVAFNLNVDFDITGTVGSVKTDLYLLIDATGSMSSAIRTVKQGFNRLSKMLQARTDFGFGSGIYRDEEELDDGYQHLQSITADMDVARDGLKGINAQGGLDSEEANLVALYKIAVDNPVQWREGAKRVILMFGDYVGHEPTCALDGITLTRDVVIDALKDAGITVIALSTQFGSLDVRTQPFGCGGRGAPAGQTSAITRETGGKFVTLSDDNDTEIFGDTVIGALESITKTVTVVKNTCKPFAQLTFRPSLPAEIDGLGGRVKVTFNVRRCLVNTKKCMLVFAANGAPLSPNVFKFTMLRGC